MAAARSLGTAVRRMSRSLDNTLTESLLGDVDEISKLILESKEFECKSAMMDRSMLQLQFLLRDLRRVLVQDYDRQMEMNCWARFFPRYFVPEVDTEELAYQRFLLTCWVDLCKAYLLEKQTHKQWQEQQTHQDAVAVEDSPWYELVLSCIQSASRSRDIDLLRGAIAQGAKVCHDQIDSLHRIAQKEIGYLSSRGLQNPTMLRHKVSDFLIKEFSSGTDSRIDRTFLDHDLLPKTVTSVANVTGVSIMISHEALDKDKDRCVESTFDDYLSKTCWLCMQSDHTEYDLWLSCGHLCCSQCSADLLRLHMPCPLCRTASKHVKRAPALSSTDVHLDKALRNALHHHLMPLRTILAALTEARQILNVEEAHVYV